MPKRTVEEILEDVRRWKAAANLSTFQAMACTMEDEEWDDLIELIGRLQQFYVEHTNAPDPRQVQVGSLDQHQD